MVLRDEAAERRPLWGGAVVRRCHADRPPCRGTAAEGGLGPHHIGSHIGGQVATRLLGVGCRRAAWPLAVTGPTDTPRGSRRTPRASQAGLIPRPLGRTVSCRAQPRRCGAIQRVRGHDTVLGTHSPTRCFEKFVSSRWAKTPPAGSHRLLSRD